MAEADVETSTRERPFRFEFIRLPNRRTTFDSTLLEATAKHIILTHRITPSTPLQYRGEEVMGNDYRAIWFLFKDQPYDVARVYRPDGTWTGCYVDVLEPVRWSGSDPYSLRPLIDLFLDLWIAPDGAFEVLDEDELAAAVASGGIGSAGAAAARETLAELTAATRRGEFPPRLVREFQP